MKVLFAFLLLATLGLKSQNKFVNNFHLDLTANQVDGDQRSGYNHIGFQIGLGTQYLLKDGKKRIGFEMNYVQRGSRQRANIKKGIYNDYKLYLNYVEVPILYIFPKWGIHFEVGPSVSYLISSTESFNNIDVQSGFPYNNIEVGAIGSANFKIVDKLYLKIRINNSITGIRKITTANTGYFWEVGAFHRGVGVNLTYYFSDLKMGDTGTVDIP